MRKVEVSSSEKMNWTDEQVEIGKTFNLAIERGDVDACRSLCTQYPWLVTDHTWQVISGYRPTWIKKPSWSGDITMMRSLLDLGFDVNAFSGKEQSSALDNAVSRGHYDMAAFLLSR